MIILYLLPNLTNSQAKDLQTVYNGTQPWFGVAKTSTGKCFFRNNTGLFEGTLSIPDEWIQNVRFVKGQSSVGTTGDICF